MFRINQLARQYGKKMTLAPETIETLNAYDWPGNVRELFTALETAFIKAEDSEQIIPHHLPSRMRIAATKAQVAQAEKAAHLRTKPVFESTPGMGAVRNGTTLKLFKIDMEKHYLEELWAFTEGDIKRMVEISGCSQSHLYSLLKKAGISLK